MKWCSKSFQNILNTILDIRYIYIKQLLLLFSHVNDPFLNTNDIIISVKGFLIYPVEPKMQYNVQLPVWHTEAFLRSCFVFSDFQMA